jgi:alkyl hydroperoxide reductase subunit AhpC
MGEMPSAKKLEEKYKDKDVVFLYVSIDADELAWKKAMDKSNIDGVHIRDGNGGWDGEIAKLYDVKGIPAYFLIDKEGKFVMDVTPRPSSGTELTNMIDKLLK